jgi:hypothetical protein
LIKIIEQYQLYKLDHLWIYDTEEEALSNLPMQLNNLYLKKG